MQSDCQLYIMRCKRKRLKIDSMVIDPSMVALSNANSEQEGPSSVTSSHRGNLGSVEF